MRRVGIYVVAGGAFLLAVALTVTGAGERPGALPNWQALILGIVQGLTEFLPISSSGHLILVPWLGIWTYLETHEEFNKTFDVALHLGTLVAVVAYFRRDIVALIVAWFRSVSRRRIETPEERVAWFVLVATVPAAFVGAAGRERDREAPRRPVANRDPDGRVRGSPLDLGPDGAPPKNERAAMARSLAVGLAQCLALAPGVSRSGVTITASRFLGLDRDASARFSFLLLVPIVFGASVLKGLTDVVFGDLPPGSTGPFVVGMLAAAVTGLVAIWALLGYVRRHTYSLFVVYRLVLAAAVLILIATGVRDATF